MFPPHFPSYPSLPRVFERLGKNASVSGASDDFLKFLAADRFETV
jgi:hypothetical protein